MSKKDLKAAMQRTAAFAARSSTAREGAFDQVLGAAPAAQAPAKMLPGARLVPIEQVEPDPNQPRQTMNKDSLEDLASSIRENGVLQPITVRWDAAARVYWIITGHRRAAAARTAGLSEIPAIVQPEDYDQQKTLQHQLVENIQREGIPPVEEARAVQAFMESQTLSQREAARRLGKNYIYVSELSAILKIEPKLLDKAAHLPKRALVEIGRGKTRAEQEKLLNAALTSKSPHTEVKRERDKARRPETHRSVHRFDVEDAGASVAVTFNRDAEDVSSDDVLGALEKVVERLTKEGSGKLNQRGRRGLKPPNRAGSKRCTFGHRFIAPSVTKRCTFGHRSSDKSYNWLCFYETANDLLTTFTNSLLNTQQVCPRLMNQNETGKTQNSEEGTSRVLKFPLHTGREPIDLAEWPVVTLAHSPIREQVLIENVLGADSDGNGIAQGWELVLDNVGLGAPIAGDQDVYVAIMALLHETDFRERVLRITRADLCRVLDWRPNDKLYKRIQDALSRFRNVTYKGTNIFTDPKTHERFGYIEFGFVDSFAFSDRPPKRRKGAEQPELPLSYIRLADEFLILCRRANLKLIDLDFFRALSRPETRWLYRFLDKNLYKRNEYRIGLRKMRRKQGLVSNYDPKYIKRDHKPRLEELKAKGFLRDWRFERSQDPDDPWQVWVLKDPTFGLRRAARRLAGTEPHLEAPIASGERIRRNSAPQEAAASGPAADLVAYFHERFHGAAGSAASKSETAKAAELLSRCAGDVGKAKHCIDWTRKEAERTNFAMQHFSALLLNGYPERALSEFDRRAKERLKADAERAAAEEYRVYGVWRRQHVDDAWAALDPVEQERLAAEQLTKLRATEGDRIRYWQPEAVSRHAMARAKELFTPKVPTFPEWKKRRDDDVHGDC